jgi:hypothetical protein
MTEQQGSERSCEKSDGKDAERGDQRDGGMIGRKEQGGEHGSEIAIKSEVIPLEYISD